MKKGVSLFFIFFLLFSSYAQGSKFEPTNSEGFRVGKSNFHAGVRAGFTGSQITGDGFHFQGFNKFGAFCGVFVNVPVSKSGNWLIQPELNFIMKGCKHTPKMDEYGNLFGAQYRLQLMYGQIPVLGKWKFYKGFELEFGPALGILFKNVDIEEVDGYSQVGTPPFTRFEFSGVIGISYLFFKHLGVGLRYEASLLPVRKPRSADWLFLDRGQHNQTFAFSVYYQF
jgi:hypothetical protein